MALVIKKNEMKSKYYRMFHGKVEKEIIDAVLMECGYNEDKCYESLIEMAGETMDTLLQPDLPKRKRNAPKAHASTPPRVPPDLSNVFSGQVERDGGAPSYPKNLFEQLSGPMIETDGGKALSPFGSPKRNQGLLHTPAILPLTAPPVCRSPNLLNGPMASPINHYPVPPGLLHTSGSSPARLSQQPIHQQLPIQRPIPAPRRIPVDKALVYQDPNSYWLVLMRGLPGSGKSYKAKELAGQRGTIFSTDDYFIDHIGNYNFDATKLQEAHKWNQSEVRKATEIRISPIIIDNTNIEAWQMKPYVACALKAGYQIDIWEMNTPWAFKASELARKNNHGVTKSALERLLDRYDKNVTVDTLKASINEVPMSRNSSFGNKIAGNSANSNKDILYHKNQRLESPRERNAVQPGDLYFDENYKPISENVPNINSTNNLLSSSPRQITQKPINETNDLSSGAILRSTREPPLSSSPLNSSSLKNNKDDDQQIRDSSGKLLTSKQLNIRETLHDRFPTVDKEALDNVLESCSFNLEASTNFIRYSGVKEREPTILRSKKSDKSTTSTPKKTEQSKSQENDNIHEEIEKTMDYTEPPKVVRTCQGAEASSLLGSPGPNTKTNNPGKNTKTTGKLTKIIDSFRDSFVDFGSEAEASSAKEPSPKKSYQDGYNKYIEYNLHFLYETFPELNKKYCEQWLKRYNGDLVKTCDYLSRVSQPVDELPQDEDGDIVEDFEMIDLTEQDEHQKKIDTDLDEGLTMKPIGGLFKSEGLGTSLEDGFLVAIDKTLAVELKNKFGSTDDFNDGELQHEDFVFELDEDVAKQMYSLWTKNLRAKKRKIESLEEDERLAKQLQDEEDKASQENGDSGKGKTKKKRTVFDVDPLHSKQIGSFSPSKNAWNIVDNNQLTPIEGIRGERLTLKQVNSRERLYSMFPGVHEESLDQVLEAANFNLELAEKLVTSSTGAVKNTTLENDYSDEGWKKVVSPPRKRLNQLNSPAVIQVQDNEDGGVFQSMATNNISYQELRAEAELHAQKRREYLQKAAEAYQAKNAGSDYYADKAREHEQRMKEAHFRAAEMMLLRRNKNYLKEQKIIDLHGLHAREAVNALKNFIENADKIKHRNVEVITGRGNHSKNGVSTIRNAVLQYLNKYKYKYRLENGGGSVRIWL